MSDEKREIIEILDKIKGRQLKLIAKGQDHFLPRLLAVEEDGSYSGVGRFYTRYKKERNNYGALYRYSEDLQRAIEGKTLSL
jgi:hypothetical protein